MPSVPVYPKTFALRSPTRACPWSGPGDATPEVHVSTVDVAGLGLAPGVYLGTETLIDTALALYDSGGVSNGSDLQALVDRFARDYLAWRTTQVDQVFLGVAAVQPTGLADIEWDLGSTRCATRIISAPWNLGVRQLGHQVKDPDGNCPSGDETQGQVATRTPCIESYGPPVPPGNTGSSYSLDRWRICLDDGRLVETYLGQDEFTCGCNNHDHCTALICVTGCPSGSGIVGALVSVNGGASQTTVPAISPCTATATVGIGPAGTVPTPGTYPVTITATGYNPWSGTLSLDCGTVATIPLLPTTAPATVTFTVTGCCGQPLPGATITLSDGQSGTTDANGQASFWVGTAGTITWTFSKDRWQSQSGTFTGGCADAGQDVTITPTPASGFVCGPLNDPLPPTLSFTDPVFGGGSITYDPAAGTWTGSRTITDPGNCGCPAVSVTLTVTLAAVCGDTPGISFQACDHILFGVTEGVFCGCDDDSVDVAQPDGSKLENPTGCQVFAFGTTSATVPYLYTATGNDPAATGHNCDDPGGTPICDWDVYKGVGGTFTLSE